MKRFLPRYYLPALLWMGGIFLFSTDLGSVNQTNSFLATLIRFFDPDISPRGLATCVKVLRKVAHVTEYTILAILWCRALRKIPRISPWIPALGAFFISCAYAGLDEFHQSLVPSRTASVGDVGFDAAGALLGTMLWGCTVWGRGLGDRIPIQLKFFGWWGLWGIFSAILLLIVLQGGSLSFPSMILLIMGIGSLTGIVGYYVGHR